MVNPTIVDFISADPVTYIAAPGEEVVGAIVAFDDLEELKEYIIDLDFYSEEVSIYYGACLPATVIPEDTMDRSIYLIILDENNIKGYITGVECEDSEELAKCITKIINNEPVHNTKADIDHIFILYGEEIQLRLTVADEDIDESVVEDCKKIRHGAEELADFVGEI